MMPISRSCFSSFRRRSKEAFNLLRRSAQSNRAHSRNYANSSKHASGRTNISTSNPVDTQPPRSRGSFVIPMAATVLGFTGNLQYIKEFLDDPVSNPYNVGYLMIKLNNHVIRLVIRAVEEIVCILSSQAGQDNCSCANNLKGPIIGGPFTLKDTKNQTVTEKNLQGNWAVLYFGYTSSPDVGPEQVQMLTKAINILESRHNLKVLPVFVTIDPERDNSSHLRAYLKEFDSKILGLTGPVTAIRQMAQEYRVFFRKIEEDGDDYLVESSHNMYLMSPNMEVVRCFGVEYNAEELSEAILKELKLREPQLKG